MYYSSQPKRRHRQARRGRPPPFAAFIPVEWPVFATNSVELAVASSPPRSIDCATIERCALRFDWMHSFQFSTLLMCSTVPTSGTPQFCTVMMRRGVQDCTERNNPFPSATFRLDLKAKTHRILSGAFYCIAEHSCFAFPLHTTLETRKRVILYWQFSARLISRRKQIQ